MAIRRHLARAEPGYTVHEAETGEAGAAILSGGTIGCVFLDYRLPDMDGIELLRRFYDVEADTMPAPFVMLTGQNAEGVMVEALRWGVHDFLLKGNITGDTLMIALKKAREIFELKKMRQNLEQKLRQAQKMDAVGQLTSGIAHDFNNLLTVILGNTHILNRRIGALPDKEAGGALAQKVAAIETAAKRGADLVRHLMVFTRQSELKQEVMDGVRTVSDAFALLRRTLGERVAVFLEHGLETALLCVDATLMQNAIINISVNARDAMPKGGKLVISTGVVVRDDGGYFMITLADTGDGMPEHVRERIFEPFFTTKPAGEGTGLGLAMVYGFIRQSGGHIEVESEQGRGTTFRIYLPLHKLQEDSCREKSA